MNKSKHLINPNEISHEKHLTKMLNILEKGNCKKTKQTIMEAFGWMDDLNPIESQLYTSSNTRETMHRAIDDLYYWEFRRLKKTNDEYKRFVKKVVNFRKHLEKTIVYFQDSDIDMFSLKSVLDGAETSPDSISENYPQAVFENYDSAESEMKGLAASLDLFLANDKRHRGEDKIDNLKQFIYEVAHIYEQISGKKFTFMPNKDKGKVVE